MKKRKSTSCLHSAFCLRCWKRFTIPYKGAVRRSMQAGTIRTFCTFTVYTRNAPTTALVPEQKLSGAKARAKEAREGKDARRISGRWAHTDHRGDITPWEPERNEYSSVLLIAQDVFKGTLPKALRANTSPSTGRKKNKYSRVQGVLLFTGKLLKWRVIPFTRFMRVNIPILKTIDMVVFSKHQSRNKYNVFF